MARHPGKAEPLTPRFKALVHDCLDDLIKESNEKQCGKRGDIREKIKDVIMADVGKFIADTERREQAAGAPAAALGGPSVSVQSLYLQALQMQPGDGARLIEAKPDERAAEQASAGTFRVSPNVSHWDN